MSSATEFAAGVRAYIATVAAVADDPADRVRMLAELARYRPTEPTGAGAIGTAMAAMRDAVAALCRRTALMELGRTVAARNPPSYDQAVALRDLVCNLLDEEILAVGGIDDASVAAMRALKVAVAADLNARAADLAALVDIATPAPLPALVQAYRQYQDLGRADQLSAYADAADPNFLPPAFRALDR